MYFHHKTRGAHDTKLLADGSSAENYPVGYLSEKRKVGSCNDSERMNLVEELQNKMIWGLQLKILCSMLHRPHCPNSTEMKYQVTSTEMRPLKCDFLRTERGRKR